MEVVGYENRGRAVRRANDRDGSGVFEVEPEERGKAQREEDAELRRRAEDHELWVRQQRLKIDHCADPNKEQQREQFVRDTGVEQHVDNADLRDAVVHLRDGAGHGQIDKDRAESEREKQRRLHVFTDGEVDQQAADTPHDDLLPVQL